MASGVLPGDELAFLTVLLDHGEAGLFSDELIVLLLMARSHDEARRVRAHPLVVLAAEEQDVRATLVLALTQEGRPFRAEPQLVRLLFKALVDVAEGVFVLGGLRCGAVHGSDLSATTAAETRSLVAR